MATLAQQRRIARQRFIAAAALVDEVGECPDQQRAADLVDLAQRQALQGAYELENSKKSDEAQKESFA